MSQIGLLPFTNEVTCLGNYFPTVIIYGVKKNKLEEQMAIELNRQLMAFIDVVNYESFVEASKQRDIAPSLLSRQIKSLEEKLGVVLLKRSTRSLALTDAGRRLYQKALQVKQLEQEINTCTEDYSLTVSGTVRLTSVSHLSHNYILPLICSIQQEYPNITFEVSYDDRRTDIIKENI